jgi:hypothetical protein
VDSASCESADPWQNYIANILRVMPECGIAHLHQHQFYAIRRKRADPMGRLLVDAEELLELVPEKLVVDIVVELYLRLFHDRPQQARASVC